MIQNSPPPEFFNPMKTLLWSLHLLVLMILTSCAFTRDLMKPKEIKAAEAAAQAEAIRTDQEWKQELIKKVMDDLFLPILLLSFVFLSSCTIKPQLKPVAVTMPDGSVSIALAPNLGGSLMSKKDFEAVKFRDGNMELTYVAIENDETIVPVQVSGDVTKVKLANAALNMFKATPGVDKGEALIKGTKDPNVIPKDPNLPTNMVVPEGSVIAPR